MSFALDILNDCKLDWSKVTPVRKHNHLVPILEKISFQYLEVAN